MRHLLTRLAAAAFVAGLAFGLSPASAAPLPKIDGLVSQTNAVEDLGLSLSPLWMAALQPLPLLGLSPALLRLSVLLPPLLPPGRILPALLELLVVGGSRSI